MATRKRALLGVLGLALAGAGAFSSPADAIPRPAEFTLPNGLQVLVIEDHRAPVVTQMVWYRVGAADEQRGKSGLAHFLEHLMFKGTKKLAVGEFSKTVARNGGQDNAFTNSDYTAYFERIARDRLEIVMQMEADRMVNLQLNDEKTVLSERDVIVEERRQRTDNNPGSRLGERMRAMLYPAAPYGTPVVGWLNEIQGLTPADAMAWYKKYYAPNNAILILAGDVTVASVRPLVEKYYGPLKPSTTLTPRVWTQDPPADAPMRVSLSDPKVRQPSMTRMYLSESYGTAKAKNLGREAYALDVLGEILGGSETSRIYRELVENKQIAVSAFAGASTSGLAGGTFSIGGTPAEGHTLQAVEQGLDAVIADFMRTGPTDAEMERAKNGLAAAAIYALDSQESLANIFGSSLTSGETIDDVVNWQDEVKKVTREEVMAAARKTLLIERSVTGELLPAAESPAPSGPPAGPPSAGAVR